MRKVSFAFLCLLVLIIPYRKMLFITDFWNAQKIIGLLLISAYLLAVLVDRKPPKGKLIVSLCLLIGFETLSFLGSSYSGGSPKISFLISRIQFYFLLMITADLVSDTRNLDKLMKVIVIGSLIANILSIFEYVNTYSKIVDPILLRASGTYGNPVEHGYYLTLISPIGFYFLAKYIDARKWKEVILYFMVVALSIGTIILTYSRAAYILYIISALIVSRNTILEVKGIKKIVWLFPGVVALILAGYFGVVRASFYRGDVLVPSLWISLEDPSLLRLIVLYKGAVEAFLAYPLFGVGIGKFIDVSTYFTGGISQSAENSILQMLAENGILFFLVWSGVLFFLIKGLWKQRSENKMHGRILKLGLLLLIAFNMIMPAGLSDPMTYIWLGMVASNQPYFEHYYNALQAEI